MGFFSDQKSSPTRGWAIVPTGLYFLLPVMRINLQVLAGSGGMICSLVEPCLFEGVREERERERERERAERLQRSNKHTQTGRGFFAHKRWHSSRPNSSWDARHTSTDRQHLPRPGMSASSPKGTAWNHRNNPASHLSSTP
jgi:hypothetical protein